MPLSQLIRVSRTMEPAMLLRDGYQRWAGLRLRFADGEARRAAADRLAALPLPAGYQLVWP